MNNGIEKQGGKKTGKMMRKTQLIEKMLTQME
jgi:hypothetical protein